MKSNMVKNMLICLMAGHSTSCILHRSAENQGYVNEEDSYTSKESQVHQILSKTIIQQINFQEAHISDVLSELTRISSESPQGIGLGIIFMDPDLNASPGPDPFGFSDVGPDEPSSMSGDSIPVITLELNNVTLLETYNIVTEMAGLKWRVHQAGIIVIERNPD